MKCPIFISYKRLNKRFVFDLVKNIEQKLGVKCWVDLDGIESNEQFISKICDAIDDSEVLLFMHSSAHLSIDFEEDYTIKELKYAMHQKKQVILVKLDDAPLEKYFLFEFGSKNYRDVRDDEQYERLISDLSVFLSKSKRAKPVAIVQEHTDDVTYQRMISEAKNKGLLYRDVCVNPNMRLSDFKHRCEKLSLSVDDQIQKYGSGNWSSGKYALRLIDYNPKSRKLGAVKATYMLIGRPDLPITQIKRIYDDCDGILVDKLSCLHAECLQYLLREHNIQTEILVV